MRRLTRSLLLLAALLGLAVLGAGRTGTDETAAQQNPAGNPQESALFNLLNQDRIRQGLKPLAFDAHLQAAAREHSQLMAQHGALSHQFANEPGLSQRMAAAGARFDAAAENVAEAPSAEQANEEFMASPGHRANIMDPRYTDVGIGMAYAMDRLYFTEDFSREVVQHSGGELEDAVFQSINKQRATHNMAPLERVSIPMLRTEACKQDVDASSIGKSFAQATWVFVFTGTDPQNLPEEVRKFAAQNNGHKLALGGCYPGDPNRSFALYKVIAVMFR